jgi:hypothetical protein
MMQKYAEEDRLEQLNDQKRRMKQLEHRKAVEELIKQRRERIEKERLEEIAAAQNLDALSTYRHQVIEQERQRLLREHATRLLGFLPKV